MLNDHANRRLSSPELISAQTCSTVRNHAGLLLAQLLTVALLGIHALEGRVRYPVHRYRIQYWLLGVWPMRPLKQGKNSQRIIFFRTEQKFVSVEPAPVGSVLNTVNRPPPEAVACGITHLEGARRPDVISRRACLGLQPVCPVSPAI